MSRIFLYALLLLLGTTGIVNCAGTSKSEASAKDEVSMSRTETMAGDVSEAEIQADTINQQIDYSAMFSGVNTGKHTLDALTKLDPNLSTFAVLMQQANLANTLAQEGRYTLFAPSNQAFADWPADSVNALLKPEHRAQLIRLLQAHVLISEQSAAGLSSKLSMESSGGEHLAVTTDDSSIIVGGATLVRPDVKASNGMLHVVDKVLRTAEDIIVD